ncbi:hypothetical protein MUU74_03495 [Chryseobacterium daecheongense]|uniref:hypothetical protein n=1 Tax=Chryseobacterium daecheongense TaxID=192389 RepID=UPI001FD6D9DC|nr:hypothetical protein [Chryseobacterium daecheongense]UOU99023.1 hypothetical protein MUU74_03495 [Chryseobacterium daecheongense]
MKNMLKYLMFFAVLFSVFSCTDDELPNPEYDKGSYLNFAKNEGTAGVLVGANHFDYVIDYETIAAVSGSHDVKLVFDAANSTAVEGTDFQIINATDNLASGENTGKFTVRVLESGMTPIAKVAKFKLQSATIPNSNFRQDFTLSMSLVCNAATFVGMFDVNNGLFGSWSGQSIVQGPDPNTLLLKDYIEVGYDIKLTYDPNSGNITFTPQQTGYLHPSYGMISMKMAVSGAASKVDFCARKVTLNVNYYVNAGSFGDKVDTLTGI